MRKTFLLIPRSQEVRKKKKNPDQAPLTMQLQAKIDSLHTMNLKSVLLMLGNVGCFRGIVVMSANLFHANHA